jgi:hypothetical protein
MSQFEGAIQDITQLVFAQSEGDLTQFIQSVFDTGRRSVGIKSLDTNKFLLLAGL